jgi:hypothetical protein
MVGLPGKICLRGARKERPCHASGASKTSVDENSIAEGIWKKGGGKIGNDNVERASNNPKRANEVSGIK